MFTWGSVCRAAVVVSLLFLAIPIHLDPPQNQHQLFDNYRRDFNKTYNPDSAEYSKRFEIFKGSLACIKSYNELRHHPNSARYGLTKFSDMSEYEFVTNHLNKTIRYNKKHHHKKKEKDDSHESDEDVTVVRFRRQTVLNGLPMEVDWRKTGIISEIKNQGLCGACWAFSTVHTIEAMYAKKHGFTALSVQQIVDCAANGNRGCSGGDICRVAEWISDNNITIETENKYPYTSHDNLCYMKNLKEDQKVYIKNYSCQSFINSEKNLLRWLANSGPVAVAVNALSWQNYVNGVVQYNCDGDATTLNHAIQLVGYNLNAEIPYYIGKNSWGTSFGDNGYIYLAIGNNTCGLANEVLTLNVI